jgi:hypothetical protein
MIGMKSERTLCVRIGLIVLQSFAIGTCKKIDAAAHSPIDPADVAMIATDAYVFGYPLVTIDQTRRVMTNVANAGDERAPMGQFANMPGYPTAAFRDVTAPNANTLYSVAWLDLGDEPYVLSLPDEHGRYYLMPMLSAWTDVFRAPGTRTTGTGPQRYVLVGPTWRGMPNVPGATVIPAPTNIVWIIGRTFAQDRRADLDAVHRLQRQYTLVPLSAYGKPYESRPQRVDPTVDMKTPVRDQVNALDAATFFDRLAKLMKDNPPAPADSVLVRRMVSIGLVAGQPFDTTRLGPEATAALAEVPKRGLERILAYERNVPIVNGWHYSTRTGTYGTDYDLRAYVTFVGLGANLPQDAVYPFTDVDANAEPLDGSRRYVLHFARGQEPPVKAFWSVTMYDSHYYFVANPINRYQISPTQSPVTYNEDGSLDLYLQHDAPSAAKRKNWLPAAAGHFMLMLRMYDPDDAVIDGSWKPPAVTELPSSVTSTFKP